MRRGLIAVVAVLFAAACTATGLVAQTTSTSGTVQELGPFTYYNFTTSDGTSVTGTSQELGPFTYYSLHSSDGATTSGSSQELGPFTHYSFRSSGSEAGRFQSSTTTGTSQQLGPFTHYNFRTTDSGLGEPRKPHDHRDLARARSVHPLRLPGQRRLERQRKHHGAGHDRLLGPRHDRARGGGQRPVWVDLGRRLGMTEGGGKPHPFALTARCPVWSSPATRQGAPLAPLPFPPPARWAVAPLLV